MHVLSTFWVHCFFDLLVPTEGGGFLLHDSVLHMRTLLGTSAPCGRF